MRDCARHPVGQFPYCKRLSLHNELALHTAVVNAARQRAAELVGPRSFREKFDRGFFTFFELPAFIALRRRELETGKAGRIGTVRDDREFEAVISVKGCDFELNP